MHWSLLGRLMLQGSAQRFAIQSQMHLSLSSLLGEQAARFRPATLLALGLRKKVLDHARQFLGIHMPQHIAVGGYTRKARPLRQMQSWDQHLLALTHPLSHP